jgi:hypothetical protein
MNSQEADVTDVRSNPVVICEELVAVAERELAAFATVVKLHFGSAEARQASEDWLRELASFGCFAQQSIPDFRQLTVIATNRTCGGSAKFIRGGNWSFQRHHANI